MRPESLLFDTAEPSLFKNTKRLLDLPIDDRETKRLYLWPNQWPAGNGLSNMRNCLDSRGEGNVTSNPEFGDCSFQYSTFLGAGWTDALLPGDFGGLNSTLYPPIAESSSFFLNSIPAQEVEVDMQINQQGNGLYNQPDTPWTMVASTGHYTFPANNICAQNLELSEEFNFGYHGDSLDSWMIPEPSFMSFEQPLISSASAWIDITADDEQTNGYRSLGPFATPPRFETEEIIAESEGMSVIGLEEAKLVSSETLSAYSCMVTGYDESFSRLDNSYQSELSGSILESLDVDPNQIDVCFGVIIAHVKSSWTGSEGMMVTPVTISPLGDVMRLSFQDSKKYAGMLDLPALCKLQEEFEIEYTAEMVALKSGKSQKTGTGKAKILESIHDCSVRIVVYGVKSEKYAVGKSLSDAGLYLQHPSATELHRHVDYSNPHYLLRPGSQIPKLEALSISADISSATTTSFLDEAQKSRFMQIFNSANGPVNPFKATPSLRLKSILMDHQVTALAMMIEKECGIVENSSFPTLWTLSNGSGSMNEYRHKITGTCQSRPTPVYGGILADDMGLGKSLSLLALVCSSLDSLANQEKLPEDGMSRATLIVAPKSTIPGWQQQVKSHIHAGRLRLAVYHGPGRHQMSSEFSQIDIVLTTYETLRLDYEGSGPLYSGTWRRVVLDEAHHIRNRSSQSFKAACAIPSKSRWCLTGTPIHNSLDDYAALLSFIGVPMLMDKSQFHFWITSPIKQKRPNGLSALGDLVRATCLRRTKDITQDSLKLPGRVERIEEIKLHQTDQDLYDFFGEQTAKIAAGLAGPDESTSRISKGKDANILTLINFLRRICNHGVDLLPQSALEAWRSNKRSVDWQMMRDCNTICDSCGSFIDEADLLSGDSPELGCRHSICTACSMQGENIITGEVRKCPKCIATGAASGNFFSLPTSTGLSAKVEALIRNIDTEQNLSQYEDKVLPVKSVIFSQWTKMLDLIAKALTQHGIRFQRIDGQSSLKQRSVALQQFKEDLTCTVMVASIGSAGEGVDLTAANHVHLVEPHWSPMAEAQAVDRVHRIGQTREVTVTRYIVKDTIETYIQWVQQDKLRLISRSLDSAEVLQGDIENARWKTLQKALNKSNQQDSRIKQAYSQN